MGLRVIVLGYLVRGPMGGMAWHHLQYVLGLKRLGYDVWFLEDSEDYEACYDPVANEMTDDPSYGLRFAAGAFERLGLGPRWAYWDAHRSRWLGPAGGRALELCASADLLLNVSGVNPLRPWLAGVPHRALIDTDPAFTQVRHLQDPVSLAFARDHTAFFTFGERWGGAGCRIPDDGLPWRPTRQPVVLDRWPRAPAPRSSAFTSVLQWESYPEREHEGVRYGMKARSFEPYLDLPARVGPRFELAAGKGAPVELLRRHGWAVRDPRGPARDPWSYQRFIRVSRGEFSIAKHGYVVSRSGWFSERSACYLASGRPVVAQETGWSDVLPAGEGLLAFRSPEEAVQAIRSVNAAYTRHARAAREVAAECFDHARVLEPLVEAALAGAGATA